MQADVGIEDGLAVSSQLSNCKHTGCSSSGYALMIPSLKLSWSALLQHSWCLLSYLKVANWEWTVSAFLLHGLKRECDPGS